MLWTTLATTAAPIIASHDYYSCSKFKVPNASSNPAQVQEWKNKPMKQCSGIYVNGHIPTVQDHSSSAFKQHLKGVQFTHLMNTGLFHEIYGTKGFQEFSLKLSE
jgi:hypothetical protein